MSQLIKAKKDVVLVGGGPVGCLMGIVLARAGYRANIFERRPDIRRGKIAAGRSINLALSVRGIHALQECGLDKEVLARAVPMYGRMMHSTTGELSFQRYGIDDSQFINSISRGELNKALITRAELQSGIKFNFDSKITDYDPAEKTLTVHHEGLGTDRKIEAPVVIGCDGSASVLRQALETQQHLKSREETLDYGYKEFTIPASAGGTFRMEKNALHIWPRGSHMLIALPNFDGSFTCTLFLPNRGPVSFESLANADLVGEFFATQFPDAAALIEKLQESYVHNPTGHLTTVHASPWNLGGQALLIGDAAHAIVPFFGQGLNCGFEDCTIFAQILGKSRNLEECFQSFSAQRIADADAIAELALDNFVEMRDKVGQKRFLLEKEIEKILMRHFPDQYVSRYSMVTFSRAPYRQALAAGRLQDQILHQLSEGLSDPAALDIALAKQLIVDQLAGLAPKGSL